VQHLLEAQEDAHSLAKVLDQAFQREVFEEAKERVRRRVDATTWRVFELLVDEQWSGARVAAELHLKVTTVYQAKHRVRTFLEEEVRRLENSGQEESEDQP